MITELQKLKLRRAYNRRKNGVVEKILKLLEQLKKQLDVLDAEQDKANALMKQEQLRIKERAAFRVAELKEQIVSAERQALSDAVTAETTYGAIAAEAAAEAEQVRKIQANVKALTS